MVQGQCTKEKNQEHDFFSKQIYFPVGSLHNGCTLLPQKIYFIRKNNYSGRHFFPGKYSSIWCHKPKKRKQIWGENFTGKYTKIIKWDKTLLSYVELYGCFIFLLLMLLTLCYRTLKYNTIYNVILSRIRTICFKNETDICFYLSTALRNTIKHRCLIICCQNEHIQWTQKRAACSKVVRRQQVTKAKCTTCCLHGFGQVPLTLIYLIFWKWMY